MAQQLQELIDKIRVEGVNAATQKSKEIENEANHKGQEIIQRAQQQADKLLLDAKEEIKKMKESTQTALKQSSRDALLALRKEIEHQLKKIISQNVNDALNAEQLSRILEAVIIKGIEGKDLGIKVCLSSSDLEKLRNGFVAKLQNQLKQSVQFESANDLSKGFTISFDKGKSNFDFSDKSLAEYLSSYLNQEVAVLVKGSV